jgi:hypothetical protein
MINSENVDLVILRLYAEIEQKMYIYLARKIIKEDIE